MKRFDIAAAEIPLRFKARPKDTTGFVRDKQEARDGTSR